MLSTNKTVNNTTWTTPSTLYKIISSESWEKSKDSEKIWTDRTDEKFIHFSTEDQWKSVINKKFADTDWVLLKIDTTKLEGNWQWEWNSDKTEKWFHLYNGWIPKTAVTEWKESWNWPNWSE
jgi:uncharacterized protein (DUF952 family)